MALPEILAAIILVSLIAYALLGGADFGGGVWDLFASGPRASAQRRVIAHAIGPIWEANHVWLILAVVLLFSAFPPAFARIMTVLHIPVALMLVGIVLRGSSFVFRTYDRDESRVQRRWGRIFATSSLLTPVFLGVTIGAITMRPLATAGDAPFLDLFVRPWLHPFPVAVGLFALTQFAFLAAVYLTLEAKDSALRRDFRARGLASAAAVVILGGAVLALSGAVAPDVAAALVGGHWWSWPLLLLAGLSAAGAIASLWLRHYLLARLLAATQVGLILLGWGLAMDPYLIAGQLTIEEAAAPRPVLLLLLLALAAGALILFPALAYLFKTFKSGMIFGPLEQDDRTDSGHR